jgi:hypothetical protein
MEPHEVQAVVAAILNKVGRPVRFEYPGNEGCKKGVLVDRAVVYSGVGSSGIPYWDIVDLIKFPNEPETDWMRIGYYRKPGNRLVFAGQTTIKEPVAIWKKLLVHAATEMPWFKALLEEVMRELSASPAAGLSRFVPQELFPEEGTQGLKGEEGTS